jgi:AAA+ superfamily predicted ATPase
MTNSPYIPADYWKFTNNGLSLFVDDLPSHVFDSLWDTLIDFKTDDEISDYDDMPIMTFVGWLGQIKQSAGLPQYANDPDYKPNDNEKDIWAFWQDFFARVNREKKELDGLYDKNIANGEVLFTHLIKLFTTGQRVYVANHEFPYAGVINDVTLQKTNSGRVMAITLDVVHLTDGFPAMGKATSYIREYKNTMPIEKLAVHTITASEEAELIARSVLVKRFYRPGTYVKYQGNIYQDVWNGNKAYRADGRVVIDPNAMSRMAPNQWQNVVHYSGLSWDRSHQQRLVANTEVEADDMWRLWPALYGFSMKTKQWGRFDGWRTEEIIWRDDAFDKLVMTEKRKSLIKKLVQYQGGQNGFEDIIEGKGGGLIVLLSGFPGVGKTLLAETVAEILHRPIYYVSIGELGTNPQTLEGNLRNILDIATEWGAVILIDEADVFLEKRSSDNLERNAMGSVFLRLLEYHNGNLFLTTNRNDNIDTAFASRISIHLDFGHMSADDQKQVWHNLLLAANVDPDILMGIDLPTMNGRQIKNCIRQAKTLALADGVTMSGQHIKDILEFQSLPL